MQIPLTGQATDWILHDTIEDHDIESTIIDDNKTISSKYAIGALSVSAVVGIIILILGATRIFGAIGSVCFNTTLTIGSGVAAISMGTLVWFAIIHCKREAKKSTNGESFDPSWGAELLGIESKELQAMQTFRIPPYSELGRRAIEFARGKVQEYPELKPIKFRDKSGLEKSQPVNPEIGLLASLFLGVSCQKFKSALKAHKDKPWMHSEVLQAADECMQVSYAISCLTLDDQMTFRTELAKKTGEYITFAQALKRHDFYLYRTFYYCPEAYHWFRGELCWGYEEGSSSEVAIYPQGEVTEKHAQSFFTEGTMQWTWQELFHDYRRRVLLYISEDELREADARHLNWIGEDKDPKVFKRCPDTRPT